MLEEVVQVLLEHLKDQAGVVLVSEALEGADKVELIRILLAQPRQDAHFNLQKSKMLVCFIQVLIWEYLSSPITLGAYASKRTDSSHPTFNLCNMFRCSSVEFYH